MLFVIFYFAAGCLFSYFGYMRADETVFNPYTLFFAAFATWDFWMGFRLLKTLRDQKKKKADK